MFLSLLKGEYLQWVSVVCSIDKTGAKYGVNKNEQRCYHGLYCPHVLLCTCTTFTFTVQFGNRPLQIDSLPFALTLHLVTPTPGSDSHQAQVAAAVSTTSEH